jgi:hypothetical protein
MYHEIHIKKHDTLQSKQSKHTHTEAGINAQRLEIAATVTVSSLDNHVQFCIAERVLVVAKQILDDGAASGRVRQRNVQAWGSRNASHQIKNKREQEKKNANKCNAPYA